MLDWLIPILKSKVKDKSWFGSVTIRIEAGKIVHLEEKRSLKPPKA